MYTKRQELGHNAAARYRRPLLAAETESLTGGRIDPAGRTPDTKYDFSPPNSVPRFPPRPHSSSCLPRMLLGSHIKKSRTIGIEVPRELRLPPTFSRINPLKGHGRKTWIRRSSAMTATGVGSRELLIMARHSVSSDSWPEHPALPGNRRIVTQSWPASIMFSMLNTRLAAGRSFSLPAKRIIGTSRSMMGQWSTF